jgi:hypothetical protein
VREVSRDARGDRRQQGGPEGALPGLLQREIEEYQQRRRAIQTINRNRVLWSKKLDQFFEVVAGRDATYSAWLDELEVPTLLAVNRRPGALGGPADGGQVRFAGFLAMETPNEGPAQSSAFYRALTGDPDTTRHASEFFQDFVSISNPTIEIIDRQHSSVTLTPPILGAYKYELRLKAPPSATPRPRRDLSPGRDEVKAPWPNSPAAALWLTIGVRRPPGGITTLVFNDRTQIRETEGEIASLEQRIELADVEIRKTKDREDEVIVFPWSGPRLSSSRRSSASPDTTSPSDAGGGWFREPENAPRGEAKGVYVTPNAVECRGERGLAAASVQHDRERRAPRRDQAQGEGRRQAEDGRETTHKVSLALGRTTTPARHGGPPRRSSLAERLGTVIQQRIASFQPERRDSYNSCSASAATRSSTCAAGDRGGSGSPKRFATGDPRPRHGAAPRRDPRRPRPKALLLEEQLFQQDRLGQEVDRLVNERASA